jgi:hypothetical protein
MILGDNFGGAEKPLGQLPGVVQAIKRDAVPAACSLIDARSENAARVAGEDQLERSQS